MGLGGGEAWKGWARLDDGHRWSPKGRSLDRIEHTIHFSLSGFEDVEGEAQQPQVSGSPRSPVPDEMGRAGRTGRGYRGLT